MKSKDLMFKNIDELEKELINLMREKFSINIQKTSNATKKSHLFKNVRRNIARIKTIICLKNKEVIK